MIGEDAGFAVVMSLIFVFTTPAGSVFPSFAGASHQPRREFNALTNQDGTPESESELLSCLPPNQTADCTGVDVGVVVVAGGVVAGGIALVGGWIIATGGVVTTEGAMIVGGRST